jgi:hypothetical protein
VHSESSRDTRLDQVEKLAELRRSVPLMKLGDHFAGLRVERGEQRRGAVSFVVMRPALHLSRLQRQQRLGAVECLDLRLLIDAEHRGMRRRIQIQADDVANFLTSGGSFDSLNVSLRCACASVIVRFAPGRGSS